MTPAYLFVYGSLLSTSARTHRLLAPYVQYVADGCMQGRLYEIDGYPGAVETVAAGEYVQGEIYRMLAPAELFERLDRYEECAPAFAHPHEYVRKAVQIALTSGGNVTAWVYVFNRSTAGLRRIASGDYREYSGNP